MFAGWGEEGLALLMLGGFRWCIDVYGGQRDLFIFFNIYFCMKLYTYIVEPLSIANVLRFWFIQWINKALVTRCIMIPQGPTLSYQYVMSNMLKGT